MKSKLQPLVRKADKVFSEYIRQRDSESYIQNEEGLSIPAGYCATCNKLIPTQGMGTGHCGHFIDRGCKLTRYEEMNCALQCGYCNTFKQGEQYKFGVYIDQRYGKGSAEKLHNLEAKYKRDGYKWHEDELLGIIKHYKEKLYDKSKRSA